MKDLSDLAGLPLYLEGKGLVFGESLGEVRRTRTRLVDTLRGLWKDPSVMGSEEIYSTYLDVWRPEDRPMARRRHLEHGYVIMQPGTYGGEYVKNYGHYHGSAAGTALGFPEVYMVLHGTGHFLLQASVPPYDVIEDVVLVVAQAGDKLIVPPNYGHLTINPLPEPLVFEGFMAAGVDAAYDPYLRWGGAAYFELAGADSKPGLVPNERYAHLPPARTVLASEVMRMEELRSGPCYNAVVNQPRAFAFLTHPEEYSADWRF